MQYGEKVKLRAYGGEEIERRVVDVTEQTVYVCRDEEFETARKESREPVSVGFKLTAVISAGVR